MVEPDEQVVHREPDQVHMAVVVVDNQDLMDPLVGALLVVFSISLDSVAMVFLVLLVVKIIKHHLHTLMDRKDPEEVEEIVVYRMDNGRHSQSFQTLCTQ